MRWLAEQEEFLTGDNIGAIDTLSVNKEQGSI